jgi:hypothetical protein
MTHNRLSAFIEGDGAGPSIRPPLMAAAHLYGGIMIARLSGSPSDQTTQALYAAQTRGALAEPPLTRSDMIQDVQALCLLVLSAAEEGGLPAMAGILTETGALIQAYELHASLAASQRRSESALATAIDEQDEERDALAQYAYLDRAFALFTGSVSTLAPRLEDEMAGLIVSSSARLSDWSLIFM